MIKNNKERFRADKDGNLDRSTDKRELKSLNNYDKDTTKTFEESNLVFRMIIAFFDYIINSIFGIFRDLFGVAFKKGFYLFEDENEQIELENKKREEIIKNGGVVVKYTYLRYLITLIVPPIGILMSKGISGWVNIIMSIGLMYINYFLGVAYGVLITFNSFYSDFYQKIEEQKYKDLIKTENLDEKTNKAKFVFIIICLIFAVLIAYSLFLNLFKKGKEMSGKFNFGENNSSND